ncbi:MULTISPECIES: glutamine--fructose-6-phosphate transaminase (isomerizing) [unclassified Prochlorococcus]|uniref:glutamine--fructose-6-phosphate transaminase (isomerizing) n=1 Tax=unclassified Prochlorococcus TaxID=2627481 RepID=UPI000533AE2C|nr:MULTISPECIES: glutamine--fructose-6-phosphate transaminase (isomerizing) [unclassified Prochlorococcus]KGG26692.1 Glucosamine--fructose-6-phosphate aminotransferase (isomerizing) [Prochlorococcus sp. MIT 0701]KGG30248.1 Glucosamine--fructose-6-phosphate aminotransferase (isomerizing) [Prochlorococcus sp. MIT 0702]KGG34932.1 Glucosamine--fructose-6-phosphate aminotransferase (isomerizing) [Prochlorococcus sp. MIT 0703]
MCGIVAVIGSREAAPLLLEGLRQLEYRGYDSAGLATVALSANGGAGRLTCQRAQGKLVNLTARVEEKGASGHCGIGHTRWATHGKPEVRNAHPHSDSSGLVAVVQNGIIENHRLLRESLEAEGVKFASETDTEVIPHLIARELIGLQAQVGVATGRMLLDAVQRVLPQLKGAYALAVVWAETPGALVVARKQAPLLIGLGEGEFLCASDTPALAGFTRTILPMEDGEVALLTPLGIELYDAQGERQQRSPSLLSGGDQVADKRHFRHFMLKEIHEQPETAQLWVERHLPADLSAEAPVALPFDDSFYCDLEGIQILACGTSRHAALVGAHLLEQFAGIPTNVFYASEFRYAPPPLAPHVLTIGVTQSGETADTLAALAMDAQRREAHGGLAFAPRQLGVTNRPESSLARQVSHILDIGAGIEVGVAATKTFLGQLLAFYALALAFAARRGSRSSAELIKLKEELRAVPNQLSSLVELHDQRSEILAHRFADTQDVIFLGRGINYPIALEGALKLKEISYIHAEGYPAGEMKHGPIALLDAHVPVVSIAMPGVVFEKVLSNAQEAKARDAKLIGVAPEGPDTALFDALLPVPEVSEWISPLLTVVPIQLLSYHIAAHRGLDVDQPRNLAKSVTVE